MKPLPQRSVLKILFLNASLSALAACGGRYQYLPILLPKEPLPSSLSAIMQANPAKLNQTFEKLKGNITDITLDGVDAYHIMVTAVIVETKPLSVRVHRIPLSALINVQEVQNPPVISEITAKIFSIDSNYYFE